MTYVPDVEEEFVCTREQALALVRKSDREQARWCLSVRLDARIQDKPDRVYPDGLGTWVQVSRAEAKRLITDMLSETLEGRGGRIHIRKRTPQYEKSKATYWITQ